MNGRCPVVVAAGGTGGHLFPAAALSHALAVRGFEVHLVTDRRAAKFGGDFPAHAVHNVAAATPSSGAFFPRAMAIFTLIRGTVAARRLVKRIRPRAVIGFGGYPTVPPLLAATQLRVPTLLHEGNAVIGRANRFLASRVDAIAQGFEVLGGLPGTLAAKWPSCTVVRWLMSMSLSTLTMAASFTPYSLGTRAASTSKPSTRMRS